MDQVIVRPLRPYEQKKLHRLTRRKANAVDSRHARVILLARGGLPNKEIARRCAFSPQWVRVLIHRFNGGGVDAIAGAPGWPPASPAASPPLSWRASPRLLSPAPWP